MKCKKCSFDLNPQAKFCPQCGEQVVVENHCPNCGELLGDSVKFCGTCGYSITKGENVIGTINIDSPKTVESANIKEPPFSMDEQADEKEIIPDSTGMPGWTLDFFKSELSELGNKDTKSKSVIAFFGTGIFCKHFYPLLTNGEKMLAIRQIQSKLLFARYRKEFVVLTNKRVIKFEKMQYFKPKIESLFYEEIREINADEPGNAVAGTFVGEKVAVSGWDDRQIVMRMVGKGAGQEIKERMMEEKKNHGSTLPEASSLTKRKTPVVKKMAGSKKKILIVIGILVAALVAIILNNLSSSTTELVQGVKNGYLGNYYDASIGEVFAEVIPDGRWDEMATDTQEFSIVQYAVGTETVIQFKVLADEQEFVVSHMKYKGQSLPQPSDAKIKLDEIYEEYYINHSEFGKHADTSWDNATTDGHFTPILETQTEAVKESESQSVGLFKNSYISGESNIRYLNDEEILQMSDDEKLLAMYEIMARHGAIFTNVEDGENIQIYFNSQDWYTPLVPVEEIYDEDLNTYEVANIVKISNIIMGITENISDIYILPYSDSIYYTRADLEGFTSEQLRLARNEIYAKHGRKFETEDLNQYFSSQPWYFGYLSAEEFDESVLNEVEKANLELIKIIEEESVGINQINQLTLDDIANISYLSNNNNVSMDIGTYSENNQIYIVFSGENEELWRGEWSNYQKLQYGGLSVTFEGYNSVTEKNDYLTVKWSSAESLDFPVVIYDYDTIGLSDSYSFSHILLGN